MDNCPSKSHEKKNSIAWATEKDKEALIPLLTALYQHSMPEAPSVSRHDALSHITRLLDPTTPHRLAIAWSKDHEAIGLAAVATFVSVDNPSSAHQLQMELKELFVVEKCRSNSVGGELMQWVESYALSRGVCRVDWHVKKNNERGIAFYKKVGAKIVGDRLSMRKVPKSE